MGTELRLGNITVDVVQKDIKNVHLSVHPPTGRVRISAPARMSLDRIRLFAISKLDWIKKQQENLRKQERETPREYLDRESHYLWGRRYLLTIIEIDEAPSVELKHGKMLLRVRPGSSREKKEAIVAEWYREKLRLALPSLISRWEGRIGVKVERVFIRKMKTRWGSCNPRSRSIRVNTELAKKPPECLEYIVVHEMLHLIESRHNNGFIALLERFIPRWKSFRDQLNQLPVRHEDWTY
jgi:predicted metal-dependent hydrolase